MIVFGLHYFSDRPQNQQVPFSHVTKDDRAAWFNDTTLVLTSDGLEERDRLRLDNDDETLKKKRLSLDSREKAILIEKRIIGNIICINNII